MTEITHEDLGERGGSHNWRTIGRLKPGVSVKQAQADINTLTQQQAELIDAVGDRLGPKSRRFRGLTPLEFHAGRYTDSAHQQNWMPQPCAVGSRSQLK